MNQGKGKGLRGVILVLTMCCAFVAHGESLEKWLELEQRVAREKLLNNISPSDGLAGSVIASPSRTNPNYYFHWVRDAALVMDVIVSLYQSAQDLDKRKYSQMIFDYIRFSRLNQLTQNKSGGLGEPKFHVDGTAFNGDWGRPQNDGPALRAMTLIRFAKELLKKGEEKIVRELLYDSSLPATTVIKADLEFVSHHWMEASFDLWEEVLGDHFYTRIVQRRALLDGAELAQSLGDVGAAEWYAQQAAKIEETILQHWDESRKIFIVTKNQTGGLQGKNSGLDVAVVLAILHGSRQDGFLSSIHDKVLATVHAIESAFKTLFPINENLEMGVAIGRYPEDKYDGYTTSSAGNPWFLATAAFAEFYYKLHEDFKKQGLIKITTYNAEFFQQLTRGNSLSRLINVGKFYSQDSAEFSGMLELLKNEADSYLKRVQYHAAPDGSLSEQMNQYTGYMQGAENLTWSYASLLTAIFARDQAARHSSLD